MPHHKKASNKQKSRIRVHKNIEMAEPVHPAMAGEPAGSNRNKEGYTTVKLSPEELVKAVVAMLTAAKLSGA